MSFQINHDETKDHPIELQNASFSWNDISSSLEPHQQQDGPTLRDITWHVPQGSLVAVVGIGELYEIFDRKRALVKYQSQSEVIEVMMLLFHTFEKKHVKF